MEADREAVDRLFANRPGSRQIYDAVEAFIQTLGDVSLAPAKTQVAFAHGRRFAWVWLPQMWIHKQPESSITLTFGLDRQVSDRRVKQCVEPYPGRFVHHVVMTDARDLDEKVMGWLRRAHSLAAQPLPRRPRASRAVPPRRP